MKKILIATDFSEASYNAASYGTDMALAIGAEIVLLHVFQLPVPSSEVSIAVSVEDIREEAEEMIAELKQKIAHKTQGKINIVTEVTMGAYFDELTTACERIKPYTVVIGSQGETAAGLFVFGSHAVYTMKHLTWPVITVPAATAFSAIKKIGLACDFDNVIDSIRVDEIKRLVNDFQAELHILNTGKQTDFNPDVVFESGLLRSMLKKLNPKYHFISGENTDNSIMQFAEKNHLDLLLVMPKRHTLVERLFHKSHTKQFVLHSQVPVMALHL